MVVLFLLTAFGTALAAAMARRVRAINRAERRRLTAQAIAVYQALPPGPKRSYTLTPGYGWNPLKKYRNLPCPCGSGRKAKLCHGRSETLPIEDATGLRAFLASRT